MTPFMFILAGIALLALFRLRATYRRVKKFDRSDEIQGKLAELRKKREEEADKTT